MWGGAEKKRESEKHLAAKNEKIKGLFVQTAQKNGNKTQLDGS